jgi:broad specificity phosphatase PhoE
LSSAERPDHIVSSPLRRCLETARPLAEALGLTIEIDPRVGEIPTPAALTTSERPAWLGQAMAGRWSDIRGDLDYDAWRHGVALSAARRAGTAIFSHFVAINAVVTHVTRTDLVIGFRPDHASITTLAIEAEGLRLVSLGTEAATSVL